ncbi:hypothetical protein QLQ12_09030 [Actinoplanes sp. NEAU-A12]|uniref:Uncharacterized protein n=1 Tax=Actinoplanes sandaracinus TaxID=3045177 RepID=A0ABT6WG89_9ACTN|nr:hypothetical protein [Actinoplanes sandaracinus]MDI6098742.1 hypothetical protein [Actinoplanes sandaracinus]
MTTTFDGRPDLVTVRSGQREIGVYAIGADRTRFVPAVDVTAIVLAALASTVLTATALAIAAAMRRQPAVGTVTMGPGGWVSIKRAACPPLRGAASPPRPWWAHALRAHRLVVQR